MSQCDWMWWGAALLCSMTAGKFVAFQLFVQLYPLTLPQDQELHSSSGGNQLVALGLFRPSEMFEVIWEHFILKTHTKNVHSCGAAPWHCPWQELRLQAAQVSVDILSAQCSGVTSDRGRSCLGSHWRRIISRSRNGHQVSLYEVLTFCQTMC